MAVDELFTLLSRSSWDLTIPNSRTEVSVLLHFATIHPDSSEHSCGHMRMELNTK